ncbi:MAG: Trp family transcriptional regulator [Patescibacteria group bacterium]
MPHVSRKKLNKNIYQKISDEFIQFVLELKSSKEAKNFLSDLLTKTERIMLAKRLAVICMLMRGYSFEAIQRTLEISPSTVDRLWKIINQYPNSFSLIRSRVIFSNSKTGGGFWKVLEKFLENLLLIEKGKKRKFGIMRRSYLGTSKKVFHYDIS